MAEIAQNIVDEFVGVAHGDFKRVQHLLEELPGLLNARAAWDETAIQAATQTGNLEIMRYLIEKGAPVDIFTAAVLGQKDEVAQMLEQDRSLAASPGVHGIPSMYFPILLGHTEIAEMFLKSGADINAGRGGNTPLHAAATTGQLEAARWLLNQGADPNPLDYNQRTPTKVAVESGHEDVAELIRSRGGIDAFENEQPNGD
jgi:ankyrin repeat protein